MPVKRYRYRYSVRRGASLGSKPRSERRLEEEADRLDEQLYDDNVNDDNERPTNIGQARARKRLARARHPP